MSNEEDIREKMINEVQEEIRQLMTVLTSLDEDDQEELSQSLSNMFYIGFNYAKRKFALK